MNDSQVTAKLAHRIEVTLKALRDKTTANRARHAGDDAVEPPFAASGGGDQSKVFRAVAHDIQMLGARLNRPWKEMDTGRNAGEGARAFLPQSSRYAIWAKASAEALLDGASGTAFRGGVSFLIHTNGLLAGATVALAANDRAKALALYGKLEALTVTTKAPTPRGTEPAMAFVLLGAQEAVDAAMIADLRSRCLAALTRDEVRADSFLTEEYAARAFLGRCLWAALHFVKDKGRPDHERDRIEGRISNVLAVCAINDELVHTAGNHLLNEATKRLGYDPQAVVIPVRRVLAADREWDRLPVTVMDGDDIEYAKDVAHHPRVDGLVDGEDAVIFMLSEHEGLAYRPLSG